WFYFINNLESFDVQIPQLFKNDIVFEDAVHTAQVLAYSKAEQAEYFDSQKAYWDAYSVMTTALNEATEKGLAKGREEGKAEGKAEGLQEGIEKGKAEGLQEGEKIGEYKAKLASAKIMLDVGIDKATIMAKLRLSEEEIRGME
ncbi:MAG: hypothetical protein EBX41_05535, partial [Chitinophagia bacterium]|nr:hypothetical protein [Chitinophagia bacterium]